MKIAILLFGHLRTYKECYLNLHRYLLDKYDCDVFMHTWDEIDNTKTKNWENKKAANKQLDTCDIDNIKKIYNLKDLIVEKQAFNKEIIIKSITMNRTTSLVGMNFMFTSMNKANELRKKYQKEHNILYDLILCIRPDILLYNFLDIEKILYEARIIGLNLNNTRFCSYVSSNSLSGANILLSKVNDVLFFGIPETIDKYILINQNITEQYANEHFLTVTSISTSREINENIFPVQIAYLYGADWVIKRENTNTNCIDLNDVYINKSKIKKLTRDKFKKHWKNFFQPVEKIVKRFFGWFGEFFAMLFYGIKIILKILLNFWKLF